MEGGALVTGEEPEGLKKRGKGTSPGKVGAGTRERVGRPVVGAELWPKWGGLQAEAAARAAQLLPQSITSSSATGPTELQVWGGVREKEETRTRVRLARQEVGGGGHR